MPRPDSAQAHGVPLAVKRNEGLNGAALDRIDHALQRGFGVRTGGAWLSVPDMAAANTITQSCPAVNCWASVTRAANDGSPAASCPHIRAPAHRLPLLKARARAGQGVASSGSSTRQTQTAGAGARVAAARRAANRQSWRCPWGVVFKKHQSMGSEAGAVCPGVRPACSRSCWPWAAAARPLRDTTVPMLTKHSACSPGASRTAPAGSKPSGPCRWSAPSRTLGGGHEQHVLNGATGRHHALGQLNVGIAPLAIHNGQQQHGER